MRWCRTPPLSAPTTFQTLDFTHFYKIRDAGGPGCSPTVHLRTDDVTYTYHFKGNPPEIPIQLKFFKNILILLFYMRFSRNGSIYVHFKACELENSKI